MPTHTLSPAQIDRLAHKRAGARMGLVVHAVVYLVVNLALWGVALAAGRHWALFPTLGWGLGLVIHAAVVWMVTPGAALYQKLLQHERARLQTQSDPW